MIDNIVLEAFPTGKPTIKEVYDVYKRVVSRPAGRIATSDQLPQLVRAMALHSQSLHAQLDKLNATGATLTTCVSKVEQLVVDVSDLKAHKVAMTASMAAALRRQAETDAALLTTQAVAAELNQKIVACRATRLYAQAVGDEGGTAWQQVERGGRVQAEVPHPRLFDIRVDAARDKGRKVPSNDEEASALAHALVESLGWDKSHVHGGYIQPGKGREAIAVVLKVTPGLAHAMMKESRQPFSDQQEVMQGWRVKRHMLPIELRYVKAIWEQFGTELATAKNNHVLFKYINSYKAVQIGDTTHRLPEDRLAALGMS